MDPAWGDRDQVTPLKLEPVTVAVNWKVTNFSGTPPLFWVDDSALVVEMARGCSVSSKPAPDGGRRTPAAAQQ